MPVGPTHGGLDDEVNPVEQDRQWDLDTAR
jgi:hypothetical protein